MNYNFIIIHYTLMNYISIEINLNVNRKKGIRWNKYAH